MKIEITPYLKDLVMEYRDCNCELCARTLANYISNKVQEAINYREEALLNKNETSSTAGKGER